MSASVQTTIAPRAFSLPMRRIVPDPPLRCRGTNRTLGNRGATCASSSRVPSVEQSSYTSRSYS
jgi:hypothetical protein